MLFVVQRTHESVREVWPGRALLPQAQLCRGEALPAPGADPGLGPGVFLGSPRLTQCCSGSSDGAGSSKTWCQAERLEPARSSEGMEVVTVAALLLSPSLHGLLCLLCPPDWVKPLLLDFLLLICSFGAAISMKDWEQLNLALGRCFQCCM